MSGSRDIPCLRQTCDTACDIRRTPDGRKSESAPLPAGRQGLRPLGNVPFFERLLCINGIGDILAVGSGYEEGCKWGARLKPRTSQGSLVKDRDRGNGR